MGNTQPNLTSIDQLWPIESKIFEKSQFCIKNVPDKKTSSATCSKEPSYAQNNY